MTHIDPSAAAARENARQATGQFGSQDHSAPGDLLTSPTLPEDTTYGVYRDGTLVGVGEKGAGMADALHRAEVAMNYHRYEKDTDKPVWTIRSEGSDTEVAVPYGDQGRIVGWYAGDAITAEEMDARNVSLTQFDSVSVEPYIDLGPYNEGDLPNVEKWARDGGFQFGSIYAKRDDETGGRHIDVDVHENFLWNAESQCPGDEYEDDSDLDADDDRAPAVQRYEAWLDKNRDIVEQVYLEWFNADIDVPDSWEAATVTLRKTVPYERFTESLVIEDLYPLLADFTNRTDPGTYGSPYVMAEVRKRVAAREEVALPA